jgi:hypothetical protein
LPVPSFHGKGISGGSGPRRSLCSSPLCDPVAMVE